MKKTLRRLPDAELELMQALWQAGRPMLRTELDEAVGRQNNWAPQAMVTMLARLEKKGFLIREKTSRSYLYRATVQREEYLESESKSLVEKLYGGRPASFIAALQDAGGLSKQDIAELEALLQKAKEEF